MSGTVQIACDHAEARLQAYVDRTLSTDEIARIEEHLASCAACARCYQLEVVVREKIKSACSEPCPEALKVRLRNLCGECGCDD